MLHLFSVSMPRAGHHVAEMVLGRLLGSRFSYCEFYTVRNCCRRIPCSRAQEIGEPGAVAFMQKSHDHHLNDPTDAAFDGVLIQVREPIARALSNYELDLATVAAPHSQAYQRYWFGLEAAYTIGFIEKWCATERPGALLLKYEDLIADPVAYYRRIFERFALPAELFDETKVSSAQSVSSADKRPFKVRDVRSSRYFDQDTLFEFQRLVAPAAATLGYAPDPLLARGNASPAVALACEARRHMFRRAPRQALAAIDAYLALPDAHVFGRRIRAQLLEALKQPGQAEAELAAVIASAPRHGRTYVELAELQRKRGDKAAARATLEACLAEADDPARASDWILAAFKDPELTAPAQANARRPAVSREEVIAAFRFILGREPEGERVIEAHQNVASAAALREVLLRSSEFAQKYQQLVAGAPRQRS